MALVNHHMGAIGASRMALPILNPATLWKKSGQCTVEPQYLLGSVYGGTPVICSGQCTVEPQYLLGSVYGGTPVICSGQCTVEPQCLGQCTVEL